MGEERCEGPNALGEGRRNAVSSSGKPCVQPRVGAAR